jgi:hypothetical protein
VRFGKENSPSWCDVQSQAKKVIFLNGEVFFFLTRPLMGDPQTILICNILSLAGTLHPAAPKRAFSSVRSYLLNDPISSHSEIQVMI